MKRRQFLKNTLHYFLSASIFIKAKNLFAMGVDRDAAIGTGKKDVEIRVLLGRLLPSDKRVKGIKTTENSVQYLGRDYQFKKNRNGKIYIGILVRREKPIVYENNEYYGKMLVLKRNGKFWLINQLPLEEYLKGVVPKEISASWEPTVLQAQTIAARTYAYNHFLNNRNKSFHIDDTERFQVFGGNLDKTPQSIIDSIRATRGQILTYRNYPILTFFHACCGGMTEKAELIWKSDKRLPYFKNIRCTFCQGYSKYNWEVEFSKREVKKVAFNLGLKDFHSIRVSKYTYSKRAKFIQLSSNSGSRRIDGNKFRTILNPSKLYSTKFRINKKDSNTFLIKGQGYGHGVGLCQAGAKKMAEKGYSTRKIINFYYKNIKMDNVARVERKLSS